MSKSKASKAKAVKTPVPVPTTAAHRSQARRHAPGFWLAALGLPVLVVALVIYVFTIRPRTNELVSTPTAAATAVVVATPSLAPTPTPPLGPADYCRKHPRFARTLGFDTAAYLTTSAAELKGMAIVQPATASVPMRVYQDPTWDDAGWLGHMTFDEEGNVYLFPAPRTSLIDNPPERQNTLYLADTDSAQLTALLTVTTGVAPSSANPFGLLGTTYDCDTQSLYASTVAGSTATEEVGKLLRIDLDTVAVVAELQGIDPFGLAVNNEANGKRLYFGVARTPELYSISLTENGDFVGQPQLELALPDRSLKAWRVDFEPNGDLVVRATRFDFNLIATSERIDIPFLFRRDAQGLWQLTEPSN